MRPPQSALSSSMRSHPLTAMHRDKPASKKKAAPKKAPAKGVKGPSRNAKKGKKNYAED